MSKNLNKISALFTFVVMIVVNALANALPINGLTTGDVSDSYPNLFAPIGLTFSIWGLIYLLLFAYVIYQFTPHLPKVDKLITSINKFFIISSLANSAWIFAWHYQLFGLSVVLMLVILFSLIKISLFTYPAELSSKDKFFFKAPFGIYFGWITIATIANITVLLVSLGWQNFIFADSVWTVIVLIVGLLITGLTTIKQKNLAYGLVPLWAYFGIYLKHTSPLYFASSYPLIINTVLFCLFVFAIINGCLLFGKKPKN